jgi:hypothetical protein
MWYDLTAFLSHSILLTTFSILLTTFSILLTTFSILLTTFSNFARYGYGQRSSLTICCFLGRPHVGMTCLYLVSPRKDEQIRRLGFEKTRRSFLATTDPTGRRVHRGIGGSGAAASHGKCKSLRMRGCQFHMGAHRVRRSSRHEQQYGNVRQRYVSGLQYTRMRKRPSV